jgi:predicted glutamine amidotransferase
MCRVLGCVSADPTSIRHELLEAENPMIRQAEEHDSGWGMTVYERADGGQPRLVRFPNAAHSDDGFVGATAARGRIFNAHVRRATMGGLTLENTHPFCLGNYSFCHNGTVLDYPRLLGPNVRRPHGDTDSEHLFNLLMCEYDPADPVGAMRRTALAAVDSGPFSGLNFLFSDGERLYAYRLGVFDLHWLPRPGQLLVASEKVTGEKWHTVQQDVLLVVDPERLDEPHAERLLGDEAVARADIRSFDEGVGLRGAERGEFAAARAARAAASANDR